MTSPTSLVLPWPPSVNHYYGRRRNGQVYIKQQGVFWEGR